MRLLEKYIEQKYPNYHLMAKATLEPWGVFLQNANNQLFIPARSLKKKLLPGAYDFSAAGHVASGQSYIDAAVQETAEELNIQLPANSFKLIGTLKPFNNVPYFNHLFVVRYNDTPQYNKDDFYKAEWLTIEELIKNIQSGHPAKQVILPSLELLNSVS
jgi:isopentenyldiphosphate isomerase